MAHAKPTILLTGFGPFPSVPDNLTARLVPLLAERVARRWPAYTIVSEVFPTEWSAAPRRLTELYAAFRPRLSLHFGVSQRAHGFAIETTAVNACAPVADAAGCLPLAEVLDETCEPAATTGLPTDAIIARLEALRIPVSRSADAGQYLCNAVFWQSLRHAATEPPGAMMAGFVHIPPCLAETEPSDGQRAFDLATALEGGVEIVAVCLEEASAQRSHGPAV